MLDTQYRNRVINQYYKNTVSLSSLLTLCNLTITDTDSVTLYSLEL